MKLRTKSHLAIALPLIVATAVLIGLAGLVEMQNARQIDEQNARRAVQRVRKIFQHEVQGYCDQLLEFLARANFRDSAEAGRFLASSFSGGDGFSMRCSWGLLFDQSGEVIRGYSVDLESGKLSEVPASTVMLLKQMPGVSTKMPAGASQSYLGVLAGNLYFIGYAPLYAREGQEFLGVLMLGHVVNEAEINRLSELADVRVELEVIQVEQRQQNAPTEIEVRRMSDGSHDGAVQLTDWTGLPVALLKLRTEGQIYTTRKEFFGVEVAALVIGAILLFILLDRLVWKMIAQRLARMSASVVGIQKENDFSKRLPISGSDEVTTLAEEINRMLALVQGTQAILERVNAEMQQRVAERTLALQQANKALELDIAARVKVEKEQEVLRAQLLRAQKMEAVGTLAGGIAHDFNNILTGIMGYAQLLLSDVPQDHPNYQSVKQVMMAADRAAALVKQILAFSRQVPGEKFPVSTSRVVNEAVVLLRAALPSNIELKCHGLTHGDWINADSTQIHQVLMNLGTNAGYAMKSHGGKLVIAVTRENSVPASARGIMAKPSGPVVKVTVEDSGEGIAPEILSRIFDPFFSTKPVNEGTGLGLAVVHGIVTDHGGWIDVQSMVGRGTTFSIYFPAVAEQVRGAGSTPPNLRSGKETVMLVDDEGLVLGVMEKNLKRLGYRVTAECDPKVALAKYRKAPEAYDLVISDYMMPGMNGLELSGQMRALKPQQRVILMTGYSPEVTGKIAEELGVSLLVDKPINIGEFSRQIRDVLASGDAPLSAR